MPLSEYEQRVLEQMEQQLTSDDPKLASTLTSKAPRALSRRVLAGVGVVVGLILLIVGSASSIPWLGVVGFLVMFAAVTFAFAVPRRAGSQEAATSRNKPPARPSRKGFMARLEDRWDRRRDQGDR